MEIEVGLVEQTTNYTVDLSSQENTMNVSLGDVTTLKGDKGENGLSAYEVALGNDYEGTEEEWLESLKGENGLSAYEVALENDYEGTEEEWLESLKGENGLSAYEVALENDYEGTEEEWLESLKAAYDDTELTNRMTELETSTIPIERGGTGGTTPTDARTNLEVMKAHVLYHNDEGNQGTITLTDSANNYDFIDIILWDFDTIRIFELNSRPVGLTKIGGWGNNHIELYAESITLSGNSITRNGCTYVNIGENGGMVFDYSRNITIRSVIGYKY